MCIIQQFTLRAFWDPNMSWIWLYSKRKDC